jgi:cell division protein ZapA (FtsZ GTPase activity inhibitor)
MLSRVTIVMLTMQHLRRRESMSQDKTLMEVSIFGQTLKLRGDANPDLTLKLAEFVDQKMRDAVPSTMSLSNVLYNERIARVAILAALNIAEELFQLRADKETEKNLIEEKAGVLLSLLEKELQPS